MKTITQSAIAFTIGTLIFATGYGIHSLNRRTAYDNSTVAVVPAESEDIYTTNYQQGEWLFSDAVTGKWVGVTGCPTEDSCRLDYHDGAWFITTDR